MGVLSRLSSTLRGSCRIFEKDFLYFGNSPVQLNIGIIIKAKQGKYKRKIITNLFHADNQAKLPRLSVQSYN